MYCKVSKTKRTIAIILLLIFLITFGAGCSSADPADTPSQSPPESSAPASAAPPPTNPTPAPSPASPAATPEPDDPEPDPEPVEPERPLPAMWRQSEVFEHSDMRFKISADWIREDTSEATIFHFFGDSDIPKMSVYSDYVSGYADEDFESFADWWLNERFKNPAYNPGVTITREEFVKYDYCNGLELEYSDANGNARHTFITLYQRNFIQLSFTLDPGEHELYRDDIEYVLESIMLTRVKLNEWPTAALPKGTPEYTEGKIEADISRYEDQVNININVYGTSQEVLDNYLKSMEASGWTMDMDWFDGYKGVWYCQCEIYGGSEASISFRIEDESSREYRIWSRSLIRMETWPAEHLPGGTPVYPGSDMEVTIEPGVSVRMYINGTKEEDMVQYIEALRNSGWDVEEIEDRYWTNYAEGGKDNWEYMGYIHSGTTAVLVFELR